MEYPGEHLLAGQIGNLFVVLAFAFSLLSTVAYFLGEFRGDDTFRKIGRAAFYVHGLAIIGMVATLFFMIFNQYFEYHYIWQHSSSDLPLRFIFSCFWEGVEGSFGIWMFWHVLLGLVLLRSVGKWEAPVMGTIGAVQVFLVSMILGIYVFEYRLGSNPFTVLLREHADFQNLPIFSNENYTDVLDGRGLNPLLQNYWMTIHPPLVLFGFATAIIPFAYAIGGLIRKQFVEWVKPALPWTFFGIGILGTGVLMGGAWAYEALSFGGFWAWDPVENSSLVPWMTVVGAGHLMLLQRKRNTSVFSLFFLTIITFCLVQYSSFLTKSGVLGESSVHSFTDLGMTGQLALSLIFFVTVSTVLLIINYKRMPKPEREESASSREFWMFIGSLVLLIAAFQIIFSTSLPVINQVFGTNMAQPADRIDFYNQWQIPFAIIISILVAIGQFFKYSKTNMRDFGKNLAISGGISLVITVVTALGMGITNPFILLLLFASSFAAAANLDYWLRILKGKMKSAGASIAHIGFGLLMLGALISTSQSEVISENTSMYDLSVLGDDFNNQENILLLQDDTLDMGHFFISYRGKRKEGHFIHYEVEYLQPNAQGELEHSFTLYPYLQLNPRMGNVAEPYTKHYLTRDIYTHITYAELEPREGKVKAEEHAIGVGDTIFTRASFMILDSLNRRPEHPDLKEGDLAVGAVFSMFDMETQPHVLEPVFVIRDQRFSISIPDSIAGQGISITFEGIDPQNEEFKFKVLEKAPKFKEFIVMKAIIFPGINILWIGCIIMALGTFFAVYSRIRRS